MNNLEENIYRQCDTEEASQMLDVSIRTMEKMRQEGTGPKYVRVSSRCIRYRIKDLIEWQNERLYQNTAQANAEEAA